MSLVSQLPGDTSGPKPSAVVWLGWPRLDGRLYAMNSDGLVAQLDHSGFPVPAAASKRADGKGKEGVHIHVAGGTSAAGAGAAAGAKSKTDGAKKKDDARDATPAGKHRRQRVIDEDELDPLDDVAPEAKRAAVSGGVGVAHGGDADAVTGGAAGADAGAAGATTTTMTTTAPGAETSHAEGRDDAAGNAGSGEADVATSTKTKKKKKRSKEKSGASKYVDMEADEDDDEDDDDSDGEMEDEGVGHGTGGDAGRRTDDTADATMTEAKGSDDAAVGGGITTADHDRDFIVDDVNKGDADVEVCVAQEPFQPGSTTRPSLSDPGTHRHLLAWNRVGV